MYNKRAKLRLEPRCTRVLVCLHRLNNEPRDLCTSKSMSDIMDALKTIVAGVTPLLVGAAIGLTIVKLNEYTEASGERIEIDKKRNEL